MAARLADEATELEADALAGAGDLSDLVRQLRALTASVQAHLAGHDGVEMSPTR